MNSTQNAFVKYAQKYNLNLSSTLLLVFSFVFLFSCIYYVGFVNKIAGESKNLYSAKEKLNQLIAEDELLHNYTNHALKINSNSSKSEYDLIITNQKEHLESLLHFEILTRLSDTIPALISSNKTVRQTEAEIFMAIEKQNNEEIKKSSVTYEFLRLKNHENLTSLKALVNSKISEYEIESTDKLLITRFLMVLNVLLFATFFILQMKKMNVALNQAIKYQNEKDEAQEHMAIVGELTSGINHEIKNILCVAGLHSNQLSNKLQKKTPLTPEEVLKSVQKIESSLGRAEKIIRSVTKLSYDSTHEEKKECSLYEIFTETKEFAEYFAQKNEVELRFESITSRLKIHCHPIQISQILLNLIKNSTEAIENLDEKWVALNASWSEELKQVTITVVDSGKGIPESVRERLFQKQFSTKAPGKGTGLGLSISAKIISDHGGELYIDEKAQHTTFVVKLPATMNAAQINTSVDEAS